MFKPKKSKQRQLQAGVTLIEMLVVVTIIGLFVALVGPKLFSKVDQAKITAARAQIHNFMGALGNYKLDTGTYPTTDQGLNALRVKPADATQWGGPYLEQEPPKDPWGTDYVYKFPGDHGDGPDLMSVGPDHQPSGDDITSWKNQ